MNAKSDLSKISVSEAAAYAQSDKFLSYVITSKGVETGTSGYPLLSKSGVGFTPTAGDPLIVLSIAADSTASPPVIAGWIAATKSSSGTIYFAASTTAIISTSPAKVGISSTDSATLIGQLK